MKKLSLDTPSNLLKAAFSLLLSSIFVTVLYVLFFVGVGSFYLLLILSTQSIFIFLFVSLIVFVLRIFDKCTFINIIFISAIFGGVAFFIDTVNLCPSEITADLGGGKICINGSITLLGYVNIFLFTLKGCILSACSVCAFWLFAPKKNY